MLKFVLGGVLLLSGPQSWGVSLGPVQSPAWLGQPLDVQLQASVGATDTAASLCLQAEVWYGDVRVPPSAISTAIRQLGRDGNALLHVRSEPAVNEPVVTVVLHTGCQTRYTRRYTLLADVAPLPQAALRAPVLPKVASPASHLAEAPVRLPAPAPRPAGVLRVPSKFKPAAHAVAVGPSRAEGDNRVRPPAPDALPELPAPPSQDGARLQLDPLTLPTTAAQPPQETTAAAPPAAASTSTENDATQLQRQLQRLREEQAQLRRSMEVVNAQLAQAQSTSTVAGSPTLLYTLSGLVVVLAGALVVLWQRRNTPASSASGTSQPWWLPGQKAAVAAPETSVLPEQPTPQPAAATPHDLSGTAVSGLEVQEDTPAPTPQRIAATLNDLLHLADKVAFFEGLGQDTDAIDLLAQFIEQHPLASELPYLWWAELATASQDGVAVAQAHNVYQHHYGSALPDMATVGHNAAGLEDDTAFMQQLSRLWPTPAALDWLTRALLAETPPLQVRTLHSLQEALWLCQIHAHLAHSEVAPWSVPTSAPTAAPVPLPVTDQLPSVALRTADSPLVAAESPEAPAALAQPEAIQMSDWLSVHEFETPSTPAPPSTEPPVVASAPSAGAANDSPMLDLDFTPLVNNNPSDVAAPAATVAPAPSTANSGALNLPPLEFDLGDLSGFKPPQPRQP